MDSFLFCFFPCSYLSPLLMLFFPAPSFGQLYSSGGGLLPAFLTFFPYFFPLLSFLTFDSQAHRPLCAHQRDFWIWMTAKQGCAENAC